MVCFAVGTQTSKKVGESSLKKSLDTMPIAIGAGFI